jgi:Site-specific recombinase XerD
MVIKDIDIEHFKEYLIEEEKNVSTIKKYLSDINEFLNWKNEENITKKHLLEYKCHLKEKCLAPTTINSKLSSLNSLFKFLGHLDYCIKFLKIQQKIFRDENKELTKEEYEKLVKTAYSLNNERLALIIQTICATGIRISELKYITVESIKNGKADIQMKGKNRIILITKSLRKKLTKYYKEKNISFGEIFLTKNGTSLDRRQIWREMKQLCQKSNVEQTKVFPHNLRHLFATTFYKQTKDIVKLSDVLGHTSINTTRIYLISTGKEHLNELERLRLVF